jgi:FMN phosphatase YigB (HAD superfamily)
MKKYAVFDIDGTLADFSHRLKYLTPDTPPHWEPGFDWKYFFQESERDIPIQWTVDLLQSINKQNGMEVIIFTGRSELVREETETWLKSRQIKYEHLLMRKENDFRMDEVIKMELITPFKDKIAFIVEDRHSIVRELRKNGFHVLQCADGDY